MSAKVKFNMTPKRKYVEPAYTHNDVPIPNPPTFAALHRYSVQKGKNENVIKNWITFLETYAEFMGVNEYLPPNLMDKSEGPITITTISEEVTKIHQMYCQKYIVKKQEQFYRLHKMDEAFKRIFDGLFWTKRFDKMKKSPTAMVSMAPPPQSPRTPLKTPLRPKEASTSKSKSRS